MAAFDKVLSGIPGLDQALDYIRMGDNVVWRVSNLEEFRRFVFQIRLWNRLKRTAEKSSISDLPVIRSL